MFRSKHHGLWYLRLIVPFILSLLIGAIAIRATAAYGLGVSTDAVDYMFTGLNLTQGKGFISYSDRPYALWPPLYPAILALIHSITRLDMLHAAALFHWITHILLAISLARLFNRFFPDSLLWPTLGVMLVALAPVYLSIQQNVSSDYLFLLFCILFFLDADEYIRTGRRSILVRLLIWGMLAALQRYMGISLILASATVAFFATPGSLRRRLSTGLFQWMAIVPLLVWVGRNMALNLGAFGTRGTAALSLAELLTEIWKLFGGWFIFPASDRVLQGIAWMVGVLVLTLVPTVIIASYRSGELSFRRPITPVLIFSGIYAALVLFSLSNVQVTSIQDRFLAPLYIPMVLVLLQALHIIAKWLSGRLPASFPPPVVALTLALLPLAWLLGFLPRSAQLLTAFDSVSQDYGNMYNNSHWANNGAIRFMKENPPGQSEVLYSNIAAGVAFHTWHTVLLSPRGYTAVQPGEQYDLSAFSAEFDRPAESSYLVWIEPNYYEHVYSPVHLRQILQMKKLAAFDDGSAVFRIAPNAVK